MPPVTDVLIVGAGAAGLMAARELCRNGKSVIIVEARDRTGGRIHTIKKELTPALEAGAEFIHGNLTTTLELLKEANLSYYKTYYKTGGELWRFEKGGLHREEDFIEDYEGLIHLLQSLTEDISIAAFMNSCLPGEKYAATRQTLKSYIEGYYAAPVEKASSFALRDELLYADEEQYRVEGGYSPLMEFLQNECLQHRCQIYLSSKVTDINWQPGEVTIKANNQIFTAKKILLTIPLGIWQAGENSIHFTPAVDEKIEAAKALGFGGAIKVLLYFKEAFWKNTKAEKAGFIFSKEEVPAWWTHYPKDVPLLTGWIAGPNAEKLQHLSEEDILQKSLQSLSTIFSLEKTDLQQQVKDSYIANWNSDPYSCGAYTYDTVNGAYYRNILKTPLHNTLYIAGEALHEGPEIGTVEAALRTGKEAAETIISHFAL